MGAAPIHRTMTASDWGLIALLALIWGGSFLFVGMAVRELPPFTIVMLRVGIGAATILAILRFSGVSLPRDMRLWRAFAVMGVLNNLLPFLLFVWAQGHITSGLASIINATTPLSTALAAHFTLRDEPLSGHRLAGVLIGIAGAAILIGADAVREFGVHVLAQIACVLATFSYGLAGLYGRRFARLGVEPRIVSAGMLVCSSAMAIPLAVLVERPWALPMPSLQAGLALLGLGTLATGFAYIIYFRALARVGATNLMLVTFLIPPGAIVLGALVLGETIHLHQLAGLAVIAAGLAVIDGRLRRQGARP